MPHSTRLVQIVHNEYGRRVALVNGGELHLLSTYRTAYAFAAAALDMGAPLRDILSSDLSGIVLDYEEVYNLRSGWSFLPSFDHPSDLTRCFVSGCANGQASSSGARPAFPPWFSKGNGASLRAHGEALSIPGFALSGAEEAELAGVWIVAPNGTPIRVGLTTGNEFADPAMAAGDARMLSHSKLRNCAIGPELVLDGSFTSVQGSVRVERRGAEIWSREIETGEAHTQFKFAEVEEALFQYDAHRVPGSAHVHYLGGSVSSYGDGVRLEYGDQVVIEWEGFGRPLRNFIERVS
ncbi:MAG: GguC protein [Acidobacteriota bacterium]